MKTYFIHTYRREESEKVMKVLSRYEVEKVSRKSAIMAYETINFNCNKAVWKEIKKELNLEVTSMFAKIKIE